MDLSFRPFRDEMFITTKAGYDMWPGPYGNWGSRKYLLSSLEQSLKRMRLDHVDLFYSHRYDANTPLEETMQALVDAVRQGKAIYAGISNYPVAAAKEACAYLRALNALAAERGESLATMALAWVLQQRGVTTVIIGTSSVAQMDENLKALKSAKFTAEELVRINRILNG